MMAKIAETFVHPLHENRVKSELPESGLWRPSSKSSLSHIYCGTVVVDIIGGAGAGSGGAVSRVGAATVEFSEGEVLNRVFER